MLRFRHRHLGNIHEFLLFSTKSFLFTNLREEKIELKVSMDSSSFPILRFWLSRVVLASKTVILLPILSINLLTRLALSRIFGKLFSKELRFSKTSSKVTSVLTTWIGGTPTKLSIKVHASRAGVPENYLLQEYQERTYTK
jgi:hypothetical protein